VGTEATGADARALFGDEAVERGRRYARPLVLGRLAGLILAFGTLALLAWTPAGEGLRRPFAALPWPLEVGGFVTAVVLVSTLARLPLAFWLGYRRERRFGLSTQTLGGWAADRAKGAAVSSLLTALGLTGLAALVRLAPGAWPLLAALAGGLVVLLVGFLAPVVLEPLFNRFRPVADEGVASALRALAERAGQAVREVLVADASRRTRKLNAYVSGLGRTRRIVVYDTLLERASRREVEVVVAHELAHRRERHVEKLVALGVAATALAVAVLWLVLGDGAGEARNAPAVLLLLGVTQLALAPLGAAISRRFEREADRVALELTRDPEAFESAFRVLADANVADLEPPRLVHALFATHPTVPERIAAARRWATVAA
jgi:STE24 endopeptidase